MPDSIPFISTVGKLSEQINHKDENSAAFKTIIYYINDSDIDITVTHRNNLGVTIFKPLNVMSNNKRFIIRKCYQFRNPDVITSTETNINNYSVVFGGSNHELMLIREIIRRNRENNYRCHYVDINIDYVINVSDLKEESVLYDKELDLVIAAGNYSTNFPHPFSTEGQGVTEYLDYINNKKGTGIFVEIVDNESLIKSRYIYAAKQLIELSVVKDPNKPSGVYFTKLSNNRLDDVHITPKKYTFNEAEAALGIYKTIEEAMSGGDPEQVNKKELAELNALLLEQKKRLAEANAEVEYKKAENARLKEEFEARKMERDDDSDRRKDHYDRKTYERKDVYETVKTVGLLLSLAIGVCALAAKQK